MRQLILLLYLIGMIGCSGGPAELAPPSINAAKAAHEAIVLYDSDGDGAIAGAELKKSPSLAKAAKQIDANGDQKLSEDEIAARIRSWSARGTALTEVKCQVLLNGQPLPGAEVVFDPEPFLGSDIHPARAETDAQGYARPAMAKEHLPDPTLTGAALGLYTIRVTSKTNAGLIPARYNRESELGEEVSEDSGPATGGMLVYQLKSS